MSWTIRSKTEKTSLASTDGVPMQEAGGTTKWFSLSSLSTFFGISTLSSAISTLQGYFTEGAAKRSLAVRYTSIPDNTLNAINYMRDTEGSMFTVPPSCGNMPVEGKYWLVTKKGFFVSETIYWIWMQANIADPTDKREWEHVNINGSDTWWVKTKDENGNPVFPVVATTASAANAYIGANGTTILKSTSSAKYKTDIVTLDDSSTLDSLRPVLYKSNPETVPGDDPTKEHYGFIAEELHDIDEKLVQYVDDVPDGVQYDRITVLLVKRIHELEARLAKAGI